MSHAYHPNARINQHIREIIQKSNLTNVELANNYNLNIKTISKWKHEILLKIKAQDRII
jgi:DNA-binding transcriptional regulator YiaG